MSDRWCKPYLYAGKLLYGGAARNARISIAGGVEKICNDVARRAALMALQEVEGMFTNTFDSKSHLRAPISNRLGASINTIETRLH